MNIDANHHGDGHSRVLGISGELRSDDRIRDPRWTPAASEVLGLLENLVTQDKDVAALVTRRLQSQLKRATHDALVLFPGAVRPQRARLLTLMIQGAEAGFERERVAEVIGDAYRDSDPKTKTTALQSGGLGETSDGSVKKRLAIRLLEAWEQETKPLVGSLWRAYIRGMLKLADPLFLPLLQNSPLQFVGAPISSESETKTETELNKDLAAKALVIVLRDQVRANHLQNLQDRQSLETKVVAKAKGRPVSLLPMPAGWGILLGCRPGLEGPLAEEWFERGLSTRVESTPSDSKVVRRTQKGWVFGKGRDLEGLTACLDWAKLGSLRLMDKGGLWWPLLSSPQELAGSPGDGRMPAQLPALWSKAFLNADVLAYFSRILPGPQRFRIHAPKWSQQDLWTMVHHLQEAFQQVSKVNPKYQGKSFPWHNDPRDADWEFQWLMHQGQWGFLLVPHLEAFNRFGYRIQDVPASSYGPLAAALVRLAEPQADDVVWDPFCGAGTELFECALAAPMVNAYGTDLDPLAIAAAQRNQQVFDQKYPGLATNLSWSVQDATMSLGQPPSLTITNPPLGRRLHRHDIKKFYQTTMPLVLDKIPRGGRLVWITPFQKMTDQILADHGMTIQTRFKVDLGGFECDMQRAVKT